MASRIPSAAALFRGLMVPMVPAGWVIGVAALLVLLPLIQTTAEGAAATGAGPRPYTSPAYQAPVRAAPGTLLYLPGEGLRADDRVTVVPEAGAAPDDALPPAGLPVSIADATGVPHGLTLRLPDGLAPRRPFTLLVAPRAGGAMPRRVRVNDTRPQWVSPAFVYATRPQPGLPRTLRVVGRNLDALDGGSAAVRLDGPARVDLAAAAPDPAWAEQVLDAALPARLAPGRYRVSVRRGDAWVPVPEPLLEVRPDPAETRRLALQDSGCRADDARDDTACFVAAIARAAAAGGAAVVVGPGTWRVGEPGVSGVAAGDGLVLPSGVSLVGAGRDASRIEVGAAWGRDEPLAVFTLTGSNLVADLGFFDTRPTSPRGTVQLPLLQLGRVYYRAGPPGHRRAVEDVTITGNRIDGPWIGIGDGGLPLRRLVVVDNDIAAHGVGLAPAGNRYNVEDAFELTDAVIARNRFHPGRYADPASRQGTIAATFGSGRRVDFSGNIADGRSRRLLGPEDGSGWRAGFFWNLSAAQEQLLVAGNEVSCPGDRLGDGEAFAFDNSGNSQPFGDAPPLVAAGAAFVELAQAPRRRQNDRDLPDAGFYRGQWVTVGEGPGLGQSRRVVAVAWDAARGRLRLDVEPAWDVVPEPGRSRVTVARQFWQLLVVGNRVDQRAPGCRKSNATDTKGGAIALWGQASDSVVAGNRQYDTDGILLQQAVALAPGRCPGCDTFVSQLLAIDVRDNLVDGEYAATDPCSRSGIQLWVAAGRDGRPVVASSGVNIESNHLRDADGRSGAAIAIDLGGFDGPAPHDWPLVRGLTIQRNTIEPRPRATRVQGRCDLPSRPAPPVALLPARLLRGPQLFDNHCAQDPGDTARDACEAPQRGAKK